MPAKQMLLVSLLLATGLYTQDAAVSYASSVDEQRAAELIRELSASQSQQDEADLVQDLRKVLDSQQASASLDQVSYELSDPDFPKPCEVPTEPTPREPRTAQDLRNAMDAEEATPLLNEISYELSDPDFPKPTPCHETPVPTEPGAS